MYQLFLVYKCNNCGKIYQDDLYVEVDLSFNTNQVEELLRDIKSNVNSGIHRCNQNDYGFSNLVGFSRVRNLEIQDFFKKS